MNFLADTSDAAYTCGTFAGALLPLVFMLLAIRSAGKPDRSRRSALSMILFMAGWTLMTLTYAASRSSDSPALSLIGALIGVPIWIAAVVFAILGILEVSNSSRPLAGLWQAITVLVLVVIFGIAGAFVGRGGDDIPADWKLPPPVPGSRLIIGDKNYSLPEPGADWTRIVPQNLNPRADIAFINIKKSVSMLVVSIPVPSNMVLPADRFVEAARTEMTQIDPAATVSPSSIKWVEKYQGQTFSADVKVKGKPYTYCEWVTSQPGFGYQVVVWGPQSSGPLVKSELDRISSGFQLLR